ncbi:hypothetical protein CKA32_001019 [Geitlerinema sp. FC II]|nr:hypothetical protein CKA32_001019 [Geitlerinema sp. FC II]
MELGNLKLGKYLTLHDVCTCTQTYHKYRDRIDPFPKNPDETLPALYRLVEEIVDPVIDEFGRDRFGLTYGFCSADLKRYLERKDPATGRRHGRVAPNLDQHMAFEKNTKGNYYCKRPGAACDFYIVNLASDRLVDWICDRELPFDSLYYYGSDRPIHISYGDEHKRALWTFDAGGRPRKMKR